MNAINHYEGDRQVKTLPTQYMLFPDQSPVIIEQCNYYGEVGDQTIFWYWDADNLPITTTPSTVAIFRIEYRTLKS